MPGLITYSSPTTFTTSIAGAASSPTLKNMANSARVLSSAIDNSSNKYPLIDLDFKIRAAVAPSGSPYMSLYFVYAIDGTNYEDGDTSTTPSKPADVIFPVRLVNTQQRIQLCNISVAPYLFKILVINNLGQALTNTNDENILSHRFHAHQIA